MQNHDEKLKDILESLLPSSRRDTARKDRRKVHQRNRRRTNVALHTGDERFDLREDDHRLVREVMWQRRNYDKVSSFIRWAKATTAHLEDPEERYRFIERLVPDNLIGRHALTHIEYLAEFDFKPERFYSGVHYDINGKVVKKAHIWTAEEIAAILRDRIDRPGFHTKLNRSIKDAFRKPYLGHERYNADLRRRETAPCTCRPDLRLLLGIHDIEGFSEHYANLKLGSNWSRGFHPEVKDALLAILEAE